MAALKATYPEARVHEVGNRVRSVYGSPMTRGNTPREAAEGWLKEHGEVFGASPLELEEHQEIALNRGGRRAYLYNQTMDGRPVLGTSLRVLVQVGNPSHVLYAAGRIAIRPEGGLPTPTVTPGDALWASRAHPTGLGLAQWSTPQLVVMYDDAPRGNGEAYPAWKCVGGNAGSIESFSFYVHALRGDVRRVHSNLMHAFDITGTVKGNATPTDTNANPEILGPDTWNGTAACPNEATLTNLEGVLILAYDPQTQAIVAATRTATDGTYSLDVPDGVVVDLKAHLNGPGSEVYVDTYSFPLPAQGPLWGVPLGPQNVTGVTAPASSQDFTFNQDINEFGTGYVNAHKHLTATSNYLGLDSEILPSIPLIVNSDFLHIIGLGANAVYLEADFCAASFPQTCPPVELVPWPGRLLFEFSNNGADPNTAYSTWISHEFGHYALDVAFGIDFASGPAFHEGFSDTLAHLVHDTKLWGHDFFGCNQPVRKPQVLNPKYPVCPSPPGGTQHIRGQLLSAIWLNVLDEMEVLYGHTTALEKTRDLHRAWMIIAQPPGPHPTLCTTLDQSASQDTLIEVLTADDDDGNLLNGTPNCALILAAFDGQGISMDIPCGESVALARCYPDFDRSSGSGVLDIFDFLSFQALFVDGDPSACDCDTTTATGVCDVFDFMCFQAAFAAGCEKE